MAAAMARSYTRTHRVRHMFAALDLASGQRFYRVRRRRLEFLGFLRQLRARFPTGRSFVICNISSLRLPYQCCLTRY
jgi:hypothetical protein